jgi:predicted TIM-barrel fold metal-dependent hydrolase
MITVDADAHVVETERTWDYMEASDQKYRPACIYPKGPGGLGYWLIDGKIRGAARQPITSQRYAEFTAASGYNVMVPRQAREMEDVPARLRHMDELSVDVQVLHATIFLQQVANRPEVEIPICLGWNRWMADVWKQGQGRLRWSTVLPLLSIPHALEQLRFASANGAVAVFIRSLEGSRVPHDPYFFPVYEEASNLNMAIVIHASNANPHVRETVNQYNVGMPSMWSYSAQTVGAFHAWALNGMPERFAGLRFGAVEVSASWLPWIVKDWRRRLPGIGRTAPADPLREFRMFVACQTDDDVPYLVQQLGEDCLMIGTDYGHADTSSEIEAIRTLQARGRLSPRTMQKIVDDNPRAFYGL